MGITSYCANFLFIKQEQESSNNNSFRLGKQQLSLELTELQQRCQNELFRVEQIDCVTYLNHEPAKKVHGLKKPFPPKVHLEISCCIRSAHSRTSIHGDSRRQSQSELGQVLSLVFSIAAHLILQTNMAG
jgi:hypothetical protein